MGYSRYPAAGTALGLVLGLVLVGLGGPVRAAPGASLPRRIGQPALLTRTVAKSPPGPAAVVFSGGTERIAVVGAAADTYRWLPGGRAGLTAQLSPDGHHLAVAAGIVDLTTGRTRPYPVAGVPQAWSPDGTRLALVTAKPELLMLDVATGRAAPVADLDPSRRVDGWTVAFAPDGSRLAYQSGRSIVTVGPDGHAVSQFEVPAGASLAGKGAWTPDGTGLLVAAGAPCDCGDGYRVRWTVRRLDAGSGAEAGPSMSFAGLYAVRALGWVTADRPAVAAYYARDGVGQHRPVDRPDLDDVGSVRLLRVESDSSATVLLAGGGPDARSVDVPDQLLASGATRPGSPPFWTRGHLLAQGAVIVVALLTVAVAAVLLIRRRRRVSA
ncbi:hypothetical protein ACWKSP_14710 [Micromonosporaceae bacterium Da 78-11]